MSRSKSAAVRAVELLQEAISYFDLEHSKRIVEDCMESLKEDAEAIPELPEWKILNDYDAAHSEIDEERHTNPETVGWQYTSKKVEPDSLGYWCLKMRMLRDEIRHRLAHAELGVLFTPVLDRANARIPEIGRRLLIHRPLWPFQERTEGVRHVRRLRKPSDGAGTVTIRPEWSKKGLYDAIWKPPRETKPIQRKKKRKSYANW